MSNYLLYYGIALFAGSVLGLFYFGVLWLTVLGIQTRQRPVFLVMGSLLFRMAVVLFAFYLIATHSSWHYLLACLIGFILTRVVMTRLIQVEANLVKKSGGS